MSWTGFVAILVAIALFLWPIRGRHEIDLKDGLPLSWLWAIAFLVSGLVLLLGLGY